MRRFDGDNPGSRCDQYGIGIETRAARDIGDREIMRDRVTESKWAYCWALDIDDREMREIKL